MPRCQREWYKNVKNFDDKCLVEKAEKDLNDIDRMFDLLCKEQDDR